MALVPFWDRLWCSVNEYCQVEHEGRTEAFRKIRSGELLSKKEGNRRLVSVPFLRERYLREIGDLPLVQASKGEARTTVKAGTETTDLRPSSPRRPKHRGTPSRAGQTP